MAVILLFILCGQPRMIWCWTNPAMRVMRPKKRHRVKLVQLFGSLLHTQISNLSWIRLQLNVKLIWSLESEWLMNPNTRKYYWSWNKSFSRDTHRPSAGKINHHVSTTHDFRTVARSMFALSIILSCNKLWWSQCCIVLGTRTNRNLVERICPR